MDTKEAYYRALFQAVTTINSTVDTHELLTAIAASTAQALGAKGCSLMLLSSDRRELYHTAAYGLSGWYVRKGPLSVDLSMVDALMGRPMTVWDAGTDPRVQYREQAVREGITSILSVPLFLRGEVIGVVRVYTLEPREFRSEDIEFVEAIANLGAIAMENAQRYQEVKGKYAEARQDLLDLYARWHEERSPEVLVGGEVG